MTMTALRELSPIEIDYVAGGEDDIVCTAPAYRSDSLYPDDFRLGFSHAYFDQLLASMSNNLNGDNGGDEIVVTAPAWTAENERAYQQMLQLSGTHMQSGPWPTLPAGYHASPWDPSGRHYMIRDGDATNSLVLSPNGAALVAENRSALDRGMQITGLATPLLSFFGPGGQALAGFAEAVLWLQGAYSVSNPAPNSPGSPPPPAN